LDFLFRLDFFKKTLRGYTFQSSFANARDNLGRATDGKRRRCFETHGESTDEGPCEADS
jgi:hypothetical protein